MFEKGPFIFLRVIGILLLIGLIAGAGYMAYNAGVAQGVSQAPAVAKAIQQASQNGEVAPVAPMMPAYGYGYGYGPGFYPHHGFGFFPFGICGSVLLVFFFFGLLRMIFFRPWSRGWGHHMHGPWGRHWENGVPPPFEEWHKRAHEVPVGGGEAAPSDTEASKTSRSA